MKLLEYFSFSKPGKDFGSKISTIKKYLSKEEKIGDQVVLVSDYGHQIHNLFSNIEGQNGIAEGLFTVILNKKNDITVTKGKTLDTRLVRKFMDKQKAITIHVKEDGTIQFHSFTGSLGIIKYMNEVVSVIHEVYDKVQEK